MKSVSLLLCLLMVLPLQAATWYVRPKTGEYGVENGESYETAWDGISSIVWGEGGVQAGDTLYVCGTFDVTGEGTYLNTLASGTAGNPIVIRGDYEGDPGIVIGAYKASSGWVAADPPDGTWYVAWPRSADAAFEGTIGGTEYVLKPVSSLAALQSTDGSHYLDDANDVFWVNPTGTPVSPRDVYTCWHHALAGYGRDYITIQNLTAYCGGSTMGIIQTDTPALYGSGSGGISATTADGTVVRASGGFTSGMVGSEFHIVEGTNFTPGYYTIASYVDTYTVVLDRNPTSTLPASSGFFVVGNRANHWTVDGCTLKYARSEAIKTALPGEYLTFTNNTITEFTVGVYIVRLGGSPANVTISNNYFDCGTAGYNAYWNLGGRPWLSQDRGAILMQPGDNYTISGNYIARAVECGILAFYNQSNDNTMRNFHVTHNRIDGVHDENSLGYCLGISTAGGAEEGYDYGDAQSGMLIAYNIVKDCKRPGNQDPERYGIGIRLSSGDVSDPNQRIRVIGNLVSGCDTNYRLNKQTLAGQNTTEYIVYNNISMSPAANGYHLWMDNPSESYDLHMDNNCWYPDTVEGDNNFKFGGSDRANHAAFVSAADAAGLTIEALSVVSDPLFTDAGNDDYTLQSASPCIDAGATLTTAYDKGIAPGSIWPNSVQLLDQDLHGTGWEIGACVYEEPTVYVLTISVANGLVAKTPDKSSYTSGEAVMLEATPNQGYDFVNWSGDLTGGANPATLVMDGNKSITVNFAANVYMLTTSASGGSVSRSPDRASYAHGETVVLTATADAGYSFSGWSGDASGTTNPVTITMDADKSVTAGFTANSYALAVAATNGSVVAVPQKDSYLYGETVSLQAAASVGYHFTGWSGDLSGSANPSSIVMNGNKSVTAGFAINTYTLSATAVNGSVVKSPEQASYTHGEMVSLTATADSGYEFSGWSGAVSGSVNPASVVMDSDKSVTASFTAVSPDQDPPVLYGASPAADAIQVPLNSLVVLRVADEGEGVDANTVSIAVNGETMYAGNVASHSSATGVCRRVGTKASYTYAYQPAEDFDFDDAVTVTVNAADLEGNVMNPQSYSFQTQMRAFGSNRCASWGPDGLDKAGPATVCDAGGNVWAVWHVGVAGVAGGQGIYLSRRTSGAEQFGAPIPVTSVVANQCNPSIAVGTDGKLYVVWQDNRRGNWDIFASTSADGVTWSAAIQVTDSDSDEVNPVVAVDGRSPNWAYVAWQDNRSGNQDIYVAGSSNGFATKTAVCVASNAQDQINPAIAIDASNTVYLVWTDYRNGSADIYGAASNDGPWTNVAVATGTVNQSAPGIAAEPTGSVLHFAWVSDAAGDDDICYGSSSGLPASPLTATEIIDDSSGADQEAPAIAVAEGPRVFVCWQDARNALNGWDIDLYMVEVREGGETNLLVGDGGTRTNQRQPAVGLDLYGRPYVVWSDDRNTTDEIYFAASTFVEPTPLAESVVAGGTGGTVGTAAPAAVDDVSVVIPTGACPYDVTVSVAKIQNLQPDLAADILPYEFGPSGLQFDVPVTITIPYVVADYGSTLPQPYWYDSLTGTMTQEGVTNVEHVALSSTIHALRFQTTHFTPYALVAAADDGAVPAGGGGGGGGGCSLSPIGGKSGAVEFFIPFLLLAAALAALRLKDARRCRE